MEFDQIDSMLRNLFGVPADGAPTLRMFPRLSADPLGQTVFLDLNHWIGMAKARKGLSSGAAYAGCYEALRAGTADGSVSVVLTAATYMELLFAIANPAKRGDLADVMSELSRFVTIRRRADLIGAQFEQALHDRHGRPMFPTKVQVFGLGCNFAFEGVEQRMQLYMADGVVAGPSDGDAFLLSYLAGELAEYLVLRGTERRGPTLPCSPRLRHRPGHSHRAGTP